LHVRCLWSPTLHAGKSFQGSRETCWQRVSGVRRVCAPSCPRRYQSLQGRPRDGVGPRSLSLDWSDQVALRHGAGSQRTREKCREAKNRLKKDRRHSYQPPARGPYRGPEALFFYEARAPSIHTARPKPQKLCPKPRSGAHPGKQHRRGGEGDICRQALYGPPVEEALAVKTSKGLATLVGCSHPGVVNLVNQAVRDLGIKPYLVLVGFHMLGAPLQDVKEVASRLVEKGSKGIYPIHRSGDTIRNYLANSYRDKYGDGGSGLEIDIQG